ncbi:MAG: hypothetical protein ACXAD7_07095 [Candidatus Kariarchaeaceae archaeon]
MAKKKKEEKPKKEKPKKEKKEPGEKKEVVFDLSDGVTWHDFAGLFILFFVFLWNIIRLILAPLFWVYGEIVRMFRFVRATGHDRIMNEDERLFVESMPLIFTMAGAVGGIIIGILFAISFQDNITDFFEEVDTNFIEEFLNLIGAIFVGIFTVIYWIIKGFIWVFAEVINFASGIFVKNPFLAFIGLATVGIVVVLLWITLHEKGVFDIVFDAITRFVYWIIGSPDRFRFKITNYYRKINHKLTAFLVGEKTLLTRTQIYFKRVTLYTILTSIYSFGAGIYVGTQPEDFGSAGITEDWEKVVFTAVVLLFAGFISGTILFGILARFLDLMNRKKYIAPEFKKEDTVDQEKLDAFYQKEKEAMAAEEEKVKAAKPWKKRETKKKEVKKEPKEKPKEDPAEEEVAEEEE